MKSLVTINYIFVLTVSNMYVYFYNRVFKQQQKKLPTTCNSIFSKNIITARNRTRQSVVLKTSSFYEPKYTIFVPKYRPSFWQCPIKRLSICCGSSSFIFPAKTALALGRDAKYPKWPLEFLADDLHKNRSKPNKN